MMENLKDLEDLEERVHAAMDLEAALRKRGFRVMDTGGGSLAFLKWDKDGECFLLITDESGYKLPSPSKKIWLGKYNIDGETIASEKFETVDQLLEALDGGEW
ncbi:MAG: hypothetical protein ACXQTL_04955 [Methanosarcinales archaeon]